MRDCSLGFLNCVFHMMLPMSFVKTDLCLTSSSQWRQSSGNDCFVDKDLERVCSNLFECIISIRHIFSMRRNCNKICNSTQVTLLVSFHSTPGNIWNTESSSRLDRIQYWYLIFTLLTDQTVIQLPSLSKSCEVLCWLFRYVRN